VMHQMRIHAVFSNSGVRIGVFHRLVQLQCAGRLILQQ
jgi:hypothetical protein